jgi:small subunit ribosomal protein S1
MVHLSEISWSRIDNPNEILQIGDRVTVQVIGIQDGKWPGEKKLALSMKQVLGDPWDTVKDTIRVGNIIQGKVTRCTKFGAFVEIAPGIEGLVHISEMSYMKRVVNAHDVVTEGDNVAVTVKAVDPENRRISLSMRDAEGDPWIDITKKYQLGQPVNGILEKKERFGYFVSLEPGITGLLHKSKIESFHKPSSIEKLSQGDTIPVMIEKIDTDERRITLAPADAVDEEDWRHYTKGSKDTLGSLGEKLQKALKEKNK